jgi:formate hydrogenlyase subunit 6/NADH:ubiquinone oxidoreductase subunit I
MGHIAESKKNLIPLIDRLNRYPIGLVDNPILRKILSLLFTDEEAFVASKFPLHEATISELTQRTKIGQEQLHPILESMADKGILMDMPYAGQTYYLLMPGVIGFFEYTFMKKRTDIPVAEVAQLMTEYFRKDPEDGQIAEFFGSQTPLTRSLVYEESIPIESIITPYESARDIIKRCKYGAVTMCYCRHKKRHIDQSCKKKVPVEDTCIVLGNGARFFTRRGFAQYKTQQELLDILEMAHTLKLTHITDNIRNKPTFICNCCRCCCEIMAGIQAGYFDGVAKTSFIARIDPAKCDYCGSCFTACNVNAIGLAAESRTQRKAERVSKVNEKICLGCGACVSSCDKQAIYLVQRDKQTIPKKSKRDLYKSILIEKGRLTPFVIDKIKYELKRRIFFRK